MKARKLLIVSIISVVCLVSICLIISVIIRNHTQVKKELIYGSWSYNYENVKEMSNNSDCIAFVKITGYKSSDEDHDLPFTTYSAEVLTPVYNCKEKDVINIFMAGGKQNDIIYEVVDDPLMNKNDTYLIFAKKNTDNTYTILSGSQGRLAYKNNKVYSLNIVNEQVKKYNKDSNIKLDNISAADIKDEIKSYVKNRH